MDGKEKRFMNKVTNLGIIYFFIHKDNGKVYVGQTSRKLRNRIRKHLNPKIHTYFTRALKKHGIDKFFIKEIYYPVTKLDDKEVFWIKYLNSFGKDGYNSNEGGGGNRGFTHSKSTKSILIKKSKGNKSAADRKLNGYYYEFVSPHGAKYKVEKQLNKFCKYHNLSRRSVGSIVKGEYKGNTIDGWKVKIIGNRNNTSNISTSNTGRIMTKEAIQKMVKTKKQNYKFKPLKNNHKQNISKGLRNHYGTTGPKHIPNPNYNSMSNAGYYYVFIDPKGNTYKIDKGFNKFCIKHNLPIRTVTEAAKRSPGENIVRGWTIKKEGNIPNSINKHKTYVRFGNEYYYKFTNPNGKEFDIKSNVSKFCKDNNISKRSIFAMANGKYKGENINGWKIEKVLYNTSGKPINNPTKKLPPKPEKQKPKNNISKGVNKTLAKKGNIIKSKLSNALKGNRNTIKKFDGFHLEFISPNNKTFKIYEGVASFCQKHDIPRRNISKHIMNGDKIYLETRNGWKIKKIYK